MMLADEIVNGVQAPAVSGKRRVVSLLGVKGAPPRKKSAKRSPAGTSKRNAAWRAWVSNPENLARHKANKARWQQENAVQVRVYRRIWARTKRAKNPGPGYRRGERVAQSKLTVEPVLALRARYAQGGISIKAVAAEFGISQTAAWKIINRETWAHV